MENVYFVEKSITLNSGELGDMLELAEQHNVIIGEAMTIYHMPIYRKLKELLGLGCTWQSQSHNHELWKLSKTMI